MTFRHVPGSVPYYGNEIELGRTAWIRNHVSFAIKPYLRSTHGSRLESRGLFKSTSGFPRRKGPESVPSPRSRMIAVIKNSTDVDAKLSAPYPTSSWRLSRKFCENWLDLIENMSFQWRHIMRNGCKKWSSVDPGSASSYLRWQKCASMTIYIIAWDNGHDNHSLLILVVLRSSDVYCLNMKTNQYFSIGL